jgi:uncharacterized protein (DUF362 family)
MDDLVIVSKGKNPYQTTIRALHQYPLPNFKGKKVLLKPNAARLALPGQGITTHPLVVKATLDYLREMGINDVAIGEWILKMSKMRVNFVVIHICGGTVNPAVSLTHGMLFSLDRCL